MYHNEIKAEFDQAAKVLKTFLANEKNVEFIRDAAIMIAQSFKKGGKVFSCGNGGSHCDAVHFAEELTGRYRENRSAYPAIAISDVGHLSCVGNDFGYDQIFSRYIEALGRYGDVLVAFSTSGRSMNIVQAIDSAKNKGMGVIVLTGNDGGNIQNLADITLRVPHFGYADRIQEVHIKIIHVMIMLIEREMEKSIADSLNEE